MDVPFVFVSLHEFTSSFLPEQEPATLPSGRTLERSFDALPGGNISLEDYHTSLEKCINTHNICPGFSVKLIEVDSITPPTVRRVEYLALSLTQNAASTFDRSRPWLYQRLPFLCMASKDSDPFAFIPQGSDSFTTYHHNKAMAIRKQTLELMVAHVRALFSHQQRVFLFSVLIFGTQARLVRWDRMGGVVTEAFPISGAPHLSGFLACFARLDPALQGDDPFAEAVPRTSRNFALMQDAALNPPQGTTRYAKELFAKSIEDPTWTCYRLRIIPAETETKLRKPARRRRRAATTKTRRTRAPPPPPTGEEAEEAQAHYFLVGRPHVADEQFPGRGTREYVALDCASGELVFLKDMWRHKPHNSWCEGHTLAALNKAGVVNVPTLVCHGDVGCQRSRTHEFWGRDESEAGSSTNMKKTPTFPGEVRHYRLVQKEICRPLGHFRHGREMLQIVVDCMDAHKHAVEKVHLMHCDINEENVLIFETPAEDSSRHRWTGMLSNWEFAKPVLVGDKVAPREADEVCSFSCASVRVLDEPGTPQTIADELESFFHLLLLLAVQYFHSNVWAYNVLSDYFSKTDEPEQRLPRCGKAKREIIYSGALEFNNEPIAITMNNEQPLPLTGLLQLMLIYFSASYSVRLLDNWHERTGPTRHLRSSRDPGPAPLICEPTLAMQQLSKEDIARRRILTASLRVYHPIRDLMLLFIEQPWPESDRRPREHDIADIEEPPRRGPSYSSISNEGSEPDEEAHQMAGSEHSTSWLDEFGEVEEEPHSDDIATFRGYGSRRKRAHAEPSSSTRKRRRLG
ncbi:hypothetical protein BKA93DRAFT_822241 [Sparassis latifolia]